MKKYLRNFKKVVHGFATVHAKDKESARKLFDEGVFDEFENKADYDFEDEITEEDA